MVVVFSFCLSLSGIHFVLVVVSPCRVQRIQLTNLLQLALNTSPRYCLALSRSHYPLLSSLSLTFFLSSLLTFSHALKKPSFDLWLLFTLSWVSNFMTKLISHLSTLAFVYLFLHPSHRPQCPSVI